MSLEKRFKAWGFARSAVAGLVLAGLTVTEAQASPPDPVLDKLVPLAQDDLARRLGIDASDVEVVEARRVRWRDSSLGCPEKGHVYLQMLTDGVLIELRAKGKTYPYHGSLEGPPFYCEHPSKKGPLPADPSSAAPSPADPAAGASPPRVVLETSKGKIVLELTPDKTPKTVASFLAYAAAGHFDGTIVYRVNDFLVQAGSTNPDLSRRPTREPIPNEAKDGLKNLRGTVGMARWGPHTATAEFYVNTKANPHLDFKSETEAGWGYCVFGRVVRGMAVVDAIAEIPTERRGNLSELPTEQVLIEKVYLAEPGSEAATAPAEEIGPAPKAGGTMLSTGGG